MWRAGKTIGAPEVVWNTSSIRIFQCMCREIEFRMFQWPGGSRKTFPWATRYLHRWSPQTARILQIQCSNNLLCLGCFLGPPDSPKKCIVQNGSFSIRRGIKKWRFWLQPRVSPFRPFFRYFFRPGKAFCSYTCGVLPGVRASSSTD